ncbi:hypothetical protein ACIGO8_08215 [Streptomyces sp. NPDC053493]|uniref:hypothetical protein n=1 Tax=Streptomyces sp. NPDC053493 TaxID=3365705 RepID=UPI0037D0BE2A
MEEKRFEVTPPYPSVEVRLPNNGGVIKGRLKTLMQKPDEHTWMEVTVPTWTRWRTQVEVGQPSREGIAPGEYNLWAPAYAVTTDEEDFQRLQNEYREQLLAAKK